MNHVIYSIEFPNGKLYIGQTNNFVSRIYNHKKNAKNPRSNLPLYNAINKYGWANLKINKLLLCLPEDVDELEKLYIKKYKTTDKKFGYNLDSGGVKNKTHSLSTKQQISASIKNKPSHIFKKRSKKIAAYSASGNLVAKFDSATDAAKAYNVSINVICRAARNLKTSCNLFWRYLN